MLLFKYLSRRYIAIVSAFLMRAMKVGRLNKMDDTENKKKERKNKHINKSEYTHATLWLNLPPPPVCDRPRFVQATTWFQVRFGVLNKHEWNFSKTAKIHEPVGYQCPRQRRAFFQLGLDCKWPWFRASSTLTRGIFQLDNNFQKGLRLHFPHGTYVCLSSVKWPAKIVNYAAGRKGLCFGLFHIVEELDIST